jgi:hypothetical protein
MPPADRRKARLGEFTAAQVPHSPPGARRRARDPEREKGSLSPLPLVSRATTGEERAEGGGRGLSKQWGGPHLRWGRWWWSARCRTVGRRRKEVRRGEGVGRGEVNGTGGQAREWWLWLLVFVGEERGRGRYGESIQQA